MSEHSVISPSSAYRWGAPGGCPGSVTLEPMFPGESGDAAKEGTASHEIGATLLSALVEAVLEGGEVWTEDIGPESHDIVGKLSERDKIPYTLEMLEGAEVYAEDVAGVIFRERPETMSVEGRVAAPSIHPKSWGSVDFWCYSTISKTVTLWDYKFGRGLVEVFANWQLINYAVAVIDSLQARKFDVEYVRMRVVQPRAFHPSGPCREWGISAVELKPYAAQLARAAAIALSPNAPTKTGAHCKYCNALHACPTAQAAADNLVDLAGGSTPQLKSPPELASALLHYRRAAKRLVDIKEGLESQAVALIKSGKRVPGFMVERGYGRRAWSRSDNEILALGKMLKLELKKPASCITPSQAGKLGLDKSLISAYSSISETGMRLKEVNVSEARQIFKPKTQGVKHETH